MESQQYPRTGIVGEAGMQVEVSVNAPEQSHVIVTLLSGRDLAAVGISPAMARELAGHLQDAAMVVAARHGRQE